MRQLMKILSLDPSYSALGFLVVTVEPFIDGSGLTLIPGQHYGTVKFKTSFKRVIDKQYHRGISFSHWLNEMLDKFSIDMVAYEVTANSQSNSAATMFSSFSFGIPAIIETRNMLSEKTIVRAPIDIWTAKKHRSEENVYACKEVFGFRPSDNKIGSISTVIEDFSDPLLNGLKKHPKYVVEAVADAYIVAKAAFKIHKKWFIAKDNA